MTHPHDPRECQEIFTRLSEYLDAELPAATCEDIEKHIAGCEPCIEFVSSLKKSIDLCRGYKTGEQPGPLPDAVRTELLAAYKRMLAARKCP